MAAEILPPCRAMRTSMTRVRACLDWKQVEAESIGTIPAAFNMAHEAIDRCAPRKNKVARLYGRRAASRSTPKT